MGMRRGFRQALVSFLVMLCAGALITAGWVTYDRGALREAEAVAAGLSLPGEAVACRSLGLPGDGRCSSTGSDVPAVANDLAGQLRADGFAGATARCTSEPIETCTITAGRWLRHRVVVVVLARLVPGTTDHHGADVSVAAV